MIANYHTHTVRCNHATGTEEEYIANAIAGGLKVLGFSDHTPYIFPGEHYSSFRMRPEQLEGYCSTVLALKEKYAAQLQIHLGLEVEYYPALFPRLLEFLRDYPVEYMILGQHFVGNEISCPYSGTATENASVLAQYCEQVVEAMHTGFFSYVAHPGLIRFTGPDATYREQVRKICKAARQTDTPLEINFLGLRDHRHYPDWRLWEVAAEEGCTVIFGSDAHDAGHVTDPESEKKALAAVKKLGMKHIDLLPLRKFQV